MSSILRVLLLLLSITAGTIKADDNPCQDVRMAGFLCLNCTTLGYCMRDATGNWETIAMLGCQSQHNFFCSDEGTFGCTWQSECRVAKKGPFTCQQAGLFPDPYDCRKYHECSDSNVDTPRLCPNGLGFSTLSETCVLSRESDLCTEEQYTCNRSGQVGGWPADNRYFYVCVNSTSNSLYPLMMKCREGFVFSGYSCMPEGYSRSSGLQVRDTSKCVDQTRYECPFRSTETGYCKCVGGEEQRIICPSGFHIDLRIMTCVSERIYQCENFEVLSCPNSTAYNEYCICIENQLQVYDCPLGTFFNAEKLVCQAKSSECVGQLDYEVFSCRGGDLSAFCFCLEGELHKYDCAPVSYFDAQKGVCLRESDLCRDEMDFSTFACPNLDLSVFCYCVNEGIQKVACPSGYYYSTTLNVCVKETFKLE
ncbi:uncharacterized protein LOC108100089 [Drosophila ficusphila]|uniref:uncharacterized protein LOC108100089 n=1 Tax=Drosophila ficusphila TaxID=30025 RepID=UPI0007E6C7A0|nr:uncharacterized protein LOC108100089 [Drosophila ficusphila]